MPTLPSFISSDSDADSDVPKDHFKNSALAAQAVPKTPSQPKPPVQSHPQASHMHQKDSVAAISPKQSSSQPHPQSEKTEKPVRSGIPFSGRLETIGFYVLLATTLLSPVVFWPSQYVVLDTIKTILIAIGVLVAVILYGIVAIRERSLSLPPKSMVRLSVLILASLIVSAIASGHFGKSFFGEGFETDTGSFMALLLVGMVVVCTAVFRKTERALLLYAALVGAFLINWILEAVRLAAGANFMSFGVLSTVTSTLVGNWYSFGAYAAVIAILSISALSLLPLSRGMKIAYGVLGLLCFAVLVIVNAAPVWQAATLGFLGLTVLLFVRKPQQAGSGLIGGFFKRLSWLPLIAFLIAAFFVWKGNALSPLVTKLNATDQESILSWQDTLDVGAGTLKTHPLVGAGPNLFLEAFLANKPADLNAGDNWGVEFVNGFGLIPTFAVTEGLIGIVVWILFFVFMGILGVRSLRRSTQPSHPLQSFVIVSSFMSAVLLWIFAILAVPSEAVLFFTVLMTGTWLGASIAAGSLKPVKFGNSNTLPGMASPLQKYFKPITVGLTVVAILWLAIFIKNTTALGFFAEGLKALSATGNPVVADADFYHAVKLNPVDIYWQARAEAALAAAQAVSANIHTGAAATTTQADLTATAALINQAYSDSLNAINADRDNYYDYFSQARVAEAAATFNMASSSDIGLEAYKNAIALNPGNPGLYLALARFQVSENQLDSALQTLGAALQVKSNYLDAVYLLSQVEASKGNLPQAITAAQFAIELNNSSPLLYFQLGLLQYTAGDYTDAATILAQAVKIEPDYANAQYFLGLAYARLGRYADGAAQFEQLASSNPGNPEVELILSTLEAGKSPFVGVTAPVAATSEKRSSLPIPQR